MKYLYGIGLAATLALGALGACSAMGLEAIDSLGGGGCAGCSGSGGWEGDSGIDVNLGDSGGPTEVSFAALCGDGCVPGTGQAEPCLGSDPGAGGAGGAGGGSAPAPGDCVLSADEDAAVFGECVGEAGGAAMGYPCLSSSDCGPGLGCVEDKGCRPYCCGSLEACPPGTYCAPVPMATGDLPNNTAEPPLIPVCISATNCTLLEDTTCPPGQTCTIVRVDGTTSCVEPGEGEAGEPCGCAAGFVCSTGKNVCLKLCHADVASDCPQGHTCQGGASNYPTGFGICVPN